jgi:hypothetical protein
MVYGQILPALRSPDRPLPKASTVPA